MAMATPPRADADGGWGAEFAAGTDALHRYREESLLYQAKRTRLRPPVSKVLQLDAASLDSKVVYQLTVQFKKIFSFVNETTVNDYDTSMNAVIKALVFLLSIQSVGRTYGQKLCGIVYRNEHAVRSDDDVAPITKT